MDRTEGVGQAGLSLVKREGKMQEMTLRCFNSKCDKAITFQINRLPEFGIDLINIAERVGWHSALDLPHSRTLVFCSKECNEQAQTKNGNYRIRVKSS